MTVVAVKIEKDKIILGADSLTTGRFKTYHNKIYEVGDIVFASAGLTSEGKMLKNFLEINLNKVNKISSEKQLIDMFLQFNSYLKSIGIFETKESKEKQVFNDYIIISKTLHKAYNYSKWYLNEIEDFYCIGSGGAVAMGALHISGDVKKSIEVANLYDPGCGGKINILEIKNQHSKILKKMSKTKK